MSIQPSDLITASPLNFQEMVKSTEQGIVAFDIECRYILWNPAMEKFTGRSREDVLGREVFDLFPFLKTTVFERALRSALKGEMTVLPQQPYPGPQGSEIHLESRFFPFRNERQEVVGAVGIIQNVTSSYQALEALRQSEEKFRKIFEESPLPMAFLEKNQFTLVNQAFGDLLGYTTSELIGRLFTEVTHPDDLTISLEATKTMREGDGRSFKIQKRYLNKNGETLWANATVTGFQNEQGKLQRSIVMIENVTFEKMAQQALQKSESDLRAIFNSGSHAIVLIGRDGTIRDYNQKALDHTWRFSRKAMVKNQPFTDFVTDEYLGPFMDLFNKTLEGESKLLERQFQSPDGAIHWFEVNYSPVRDNRGVITDVCLTINLIDERRMVQKALIESEERYRRLVEFSPEAVMVHSEGKILYANPACLKGLGNITLEEAVGRPILDFIHPEYRAGIVSRVRKISEKGESNEFLETKMIDLEGQVLEVETKGTPFLYQGKPSVLTLVRDISERKKNQKMLLQYERLAAVGKVIAAIAHEIRNPLSMVAGTSQVLKERLADQPEFAKDIETLLTQTERLRNFMNDILDYSKEMAIKKGAIGAKGLLEQSLKLAQAQAGKKALRTHIRWEMDTNLPDLWVDGDRLTQVLVNVILNSLQAMDQEESVLTISGRVQASMERIVLGIQDNGTGIKEAELEHLFEPFYTTKKHGTGLGLSISRKIMEAHGGSIEIHPGILQGTICTIQIPLRKA